MRIVIISITVSNLGNYDVRVCMQSGVNSRRELFKCLGVGGDCGKCNPQVKELLNNSEQTCNQYMMQNSPNQTILAV
jgi:bacterioferritin-associated ferredoxin